MKELRLQVYVFVMFKSVLCFTWELKLPVFRRVFENIYQLCQMLEKY